MSETEQPQARLQFETALRTNQNSPAKVQYFRWAFSFAGLSIRVDLFDLPFDCGEKALPET
jgi:hypothetical protein